jgi:peptide/nickel transport system ATP-binding protein
LKDKNNILNIENLVVYYETENGIIKAVNGIDLQLKKKKSIGLVGETGAGKTTTALAMLRLIPDPPGVIKSGVIELDGENILDKNTKELERIRGKDIAMIFQDPMTALNPVFTVGEQIAESILLHENVTKSEANKRAKEMLELVGISGYRVNDYPHQFSGGMKQRVVIAIALACHPKLLIADEPTTAPIAKETNTAAKPIDNEYLAPYRILKKISRPYWSVPNGCSNEGDFKRRGTLCLIILS